MLLATTIAIWEFIGLRTLDPDRPLGALESPPVPWGGLAGREAARALEWRWRLDPEAAAGPLLAQLGHYPLDPWRWLLYSRIQWANTDDPQALRRNLAAAISVQPHNREVRWRAANLAQSTVDAELVLDQMALWLADEPRDTGRALFIAGRWADDPGTLLDRVVPAEEAFLTEAMEYARRSNDVALAQAAWQRLNHPRAPQDEAFADYVATALDNERPDLAMEAWQAVDPDYRPGDVPAGDFGVPLEAMATFGWSLRMPEGAGLERVALPDADVGAISRSRSDNPAEGDRGLEAAPTRGGEEGASPPDVGAISRSRSDNPAGGDRGLEAAPTRGGEEEASPTDVGAISRSRPEPAEADRGLEAAPTGGHALHITFNGEKNIHLAAPAVRFPMPEPGRYRLTGWWRADGLTTRSLPYLQLYAESPDHPFSETVTVPGQKFGWQRFEIPFEVNEAGELFRFRLRRNRTDAFDRYISGSVWLAALEIEAVRVGEGED